MQASNPITTMPKRDWLLLSALAILTAFLLMLATETALSRRYTKSSRTLGNCLDYAHAGAGIPNLANCKTVDKSYETPLVHYTFNACGLRSDVGCQPFQPGSTTIAMLGTSVGMGQWVDDDQTLGHQIEMDTARAGGQEIHVANYSRMEEAPPAMVQLLPQILQKRPNMVLVVLSPYDVKIATTNLQKAASIAKLTHVGRIQWWMHYLSTIVQTESPSELAYTLYDHLRSRVQGSRLAAWIDDYVYANDARYVRQYLNGEMTETGYLDPHPTTYWEKSYVGLDEEIRQMSALTHERGIPLVVVLLPTHAQSILLAYPAIAREFPAVDPYYLGRRVQSMVASDGGIFLNLYPDYAGRKDLGADYYYDNGHPDAKALAIFAQMMTAHLEREDIPGFAIPPSKLP